MVNYSAITEIVQCRCDLGEGIFSAGNDLHWFDINAQKFHSYSDSRHSSIGLPEQFSVGVLTDSDNFLFASETGLWLFDPICQTLEKYKDVEEDNAQTRSNDGRADRQGGFWFSTMGKQAEIGFGSLYRLYQGEVVKIRSDLSIPNAICFSPDAQYAYFADSAEQLIYRWSLDAEGWPIQEPSVWVDLSDTTISPDGAVVDSCGYMWNAQWDGSRIVRYAPSGMVDKIVELPVSRPTCPAFWGDGLQDLAITTAREGLPTNRLAEETMAGNVLSISLQVSGLPGVKVLLGEVK